MMNRDTVRRSFANLANDLTGKFFYDAKRQMNVKIVLVEQNKATLVYKTRNKRRPQAPGREGAVVPSLLPAEVPIRCDIAWGIGKLIF